MFEGELKDDSGDDVDADSIQDFRPDVTFNTV